VLFSKVKIDGGFGEAHLALLESGSERLGSIAPYVRQVYLVLPNPHIPVLARFPNVKALIIQGTVDVPALLADIPVGLNITEVRFTMCQLESFGEILKLLAAIDNLKKLVVTRTVSWRTFYDEEEEAEEDPSRWAGAFKNLQSCEVMANPKQWMNWIGPKRLGIAPDLRSFKTYANPTDEHVALLSLFEGRENSFESLTIGFSHLVATNVTSSVDYWGVYDFVRLYSLI